MSATRTPKISTASRRSIGAALGLALLVAGAPFLTAANAAQPTGDATAAAETAAVTGANAADPAIWVNPSDATKSLILGADDTRLVTYDMTGAVKAQPGIPAGTTAGDFTGIDVRNGVTLNGAPASVATAVGNGTAHFYSIDPGSDAVTDVSATTGGIAMTPYWHSGKVSSVCMYQSPVSDKTYAFMLSSNGEMAQVDLTDSAGKIAVNAADVVRGGKAAVWDVTSDGTTVSGCVADDATKTVYVSGQAGIWKFGAEPTDPTSGTLIDTPLSATPAGHVLASGAKGLAMVETGDGSGYLIASTLDTTATASVTNSFNVYDRATDAYIRTFKVTVGAAADGCELTEGIAAAAAAAGNLGSNFPAGMFVCQDKQNRPGINGPSPNDPMNYKMVALDAIVDMTAPAPTTTTAPATTPAVQVPNRSGYWMVGADGRVYNFGDAKSYGDATMAPGAGAIDIEPTPSGNGYWIVDDQGHVFPRGDAGSFGDVKGSILQPGEFVTSISSTATGQGYWIFTTLGRVTSFGDATWYGDMSQTKLNGPVLDSIPSADGKGYYMVASDGGIFTFGDAVFKGSMGGQPLNKPVQSLVPAADGNGYWLVASDGGIFSFGGARFRGSMGAVKLNKPVTGMVRFGDGYLMVAEDGGIFSFSDQPFFGSLGSHPPAQPITSVAVLDAPAAAQ